MCASSSSLDGQGLRLLWSAERKELQVASLKENREDGISKGSLQILKTARQSTRLGCAVPVLEILDLGMAEKHPEPPSGELLGGIQKEEEGSRDKKQQKQKEKTNKKPPPLKSVKGIFPGVIYGHQRRNITRIITGCLLWKSMCSESGGRELYFPFYLVPTSISVNRIIYSRLSLACFPDINV